MVPLVKVPTEEYFLQQLAYPPYPTPTPYSPANVHQPISNSLQLSDVIPTNVSGTSSNDTTNVQSTSGRQPSFDTFPAYVVAIVVVVFFVMTSTFLYFLCRCIVRKKKREDRLAALTPDAGRMMAGVRANQPIEFVVPSTTTVVLSETTEDSVSETDYSSSGGVRNHLPGQRRKRCSGFQINPEDLQHGLYVGVTAASSEKGDFVGDRGKVGFSLRYNLQRSQLTIRIIGCKDLPCHSLKTSANPCAKVVLLPDRTTKYVTRVVKNTSQPTFNELFSFCVRRDELPDKQLKISVWDYDRFSRKCLIGQVLYDVRDSGLTNTLSVDATSGEIWTDLKQDLKQHSENGEILLSLCYDPDTATLTLSVLKTRGFNVHQDKGKETSIYAKVTLYVRRKLVRTKKTPSRKIQDSGAEFNSPFSIHVPQAALREVDLTVAVCERWPLGKRVLGRTWAGTNCPCDQGLQHWHDMLASPKSTCAQWHVLST